MTEHRVLQLSCTFLLLLCAGCASKELTREKAQSMIDRKEDFARASSIPIDAQVFDALVRDKLLFQSRFDAWWQMTDETKEYFASVTLNQFTLIKPVKRQVADADGITDGILPGTKVVAFRYQYSDVPDFVSKHTGLGTKKLPAEGLFQFSEDGWRLVDIQYR